jgi:hypothetical protein
LGEAGLIGNSDNEIALCHWSVYSMGKRLCDA